MKLFIHLMIGILGLTTICSAQENKPMTNNKFPMPAYIHHSQWEAFPPLGFPAEAIRRNLSPGESLKIRDINVVLVKTNPIDTAKGIKKETVLLQLNRAKKQEEKIVKEGEAINWEGVHIAVLAIHLTPGELGQGLTEFEAAVTDTMPAQYAQSTVAGKASSRVRISHQINLITLHHSGDPKPITLKDDPAKILRFLQTWGRDDKNWWDVPYHFFIAPDGKIYEGRDWHYIGETNTKYDPSGHFLINVLGNYEIQTPNPAQLNAIMDLMAWAVSEFNIPLDRIKGHRDYADTDCPGMNLYSYLKDGTIRKGIEERLHRASTK